ncbi:hypothetical protein SAMN05216303_102831 [Rhodoferax sp. OV413]|uniref:hypothetical protein n=1 Tax=Rhodoferax sp. OV413 TaxID=1855285 RepID=UPI00088FE8C6|nr:hypothetical protein [Rhodoferax sp. OV413]SDO97392.1 hypothetical protein SAMN05216303_102831 [Rhodoferax sp. OV413]
MEPADVHTYSPRGYTDKAEMTMAVPQHACRCMYAHGSGLSPTQATTDAVDEVWKPVAVDESKNAQPERLAKKQSVVISFGANNQIY